MTGIFTAKTLDEAKELAAKEFGAEISAITFTVLEEPKKTLFGKTKGEARVQADYTETKDKVAARYILSVLQSMGVENAAVQIGEMENGAMLNLSGDGLADLIGKKGELLDSLQYLASLICNRVDKEYFRIATDCDGFRERRKAQLEALAGKIAASVKRTGRTSTLEPMNPYERRIVHATVSEIEGVTSRSVGEEPYRKVLISSTTPRTDKGNNFKGGQGGGRGKPRDNRRRDTRKPKAFDIKTSFEKDYKKPKPEDDLPAGDLYSKIEF